MDQNSARDMMIGGVDVKATRALQKRMKRKRKSHLYQQKGMKSVKTAERDSGEMLMESGEDIEESDDGLEKSESDEQFESSSESETSHTGRYPQKSTQNRHQYPELSQMMERTGTSNRDACKLVNALLQDMGLNSCENILEQSKLRRQRILWRNRAIVDHSLTTKQCICIGFDGRVDETRLLKTERVQRTEKEDHYVIISFPDEKYIDHVAPQSAKATDVAAELISVLHETDSITSLLAIASDSTNVNTGEHNGIIRNMELTLKRPLQWLICMLHLNELPFREIFKSIDGKTAGPLKFKGAIGKSLEFDPCSLPITDFRQVPGVTEDVSDDIKNDLSQDQKYLLRACLAVQAGQRDMSDKEKKFFETSQPGALNHARWLTRANRTLRLYLGTEEPSDQLVKLVTFIVNVYAPSWFNIKTHPHCTDGSQNFFFMMERSRVLTDVKMHEDAKKTLTRNCYFAHPENILLAALVDHNIDVRRDAVLKIIKCRQASCQDGFRKFSKSDCHLNWDATNYYDMINWSSSVITVPPLVGSMSNEELLAAVEIGPVDIPALPCHTQAVEWAVKEVTKAAAKVVGHRTRHGMILSAQKSRNRRRNVESKHSFLS